MHLSRIELVNFKNIPQAEMAFSEKVNCILGNNGAGKTTLLDAIYYLAFCKSFFNPIDSQNIRHGEDFFVIDGHFEINGETHRIFCGQKRNEKKRFRKDKKEYARLADHIGFIPLVMIAPSDTQLITEGSDVRRKFMDGIIAQYDPAYLDTLMQYNRQLAQRNAMLKHLWAEGRRPDETTFEVFDEQLHALGTEIFNKRKQFLDSYLPIFSSFYTAVCADSERVHITYESQLNEGSLIDLLKASRQNDMRAQYTTRGIHKDDLIFEIGDGYAMKKFGSQGQQKSFAVALKLAQFDYLKQVKLKKPILLLDDVFDKLDDQRVAALMRLVSEDHFGQIFITDANLHRVPDLFEGANVPLNKYLVDSGNVKPL
ncbi:MAG: DNA replication and repair protein RecF [Salibacteraceae bacterium]